MKRNRILYFFLIISTIIIGLASRKYSSHLPEIINLGLGDALWAVMMYFIMGFFFPRFSVQKLAFLSLSICFLIEFSQLLQEDWIIALRNNRFGLLVLGKGFLWSDLVAYSIGIGLSIATEKYLLRPK